MRFISAIGSLLMVLAFFAVPAFAADQSVSGALVEVLHTKGVLDEATYTDLKNTETAGGEGALNKKLVEVLHTKGVIDDATYSKLSAQAEAPAPAPVAVPVPASTAAAERPFDKTMSSFEESFARLGGDTVKLKIGTWLQGGYAYDNRHPRGLSVPLAESSATNTSTSNAFFLRFARIYFNGTLSDKVGFRVMLDGVSGPLQDAYVYFDYIPYTRVTLGQFLTPFGDETWRAPFDLPVINYSLASIYMQFANFRDIGLMASSKYITKGDWPVGGGIQTALVNGKGTNGTEDNNAKDWMGRAWINPFVPGLSVGGSWYMGKLTNKKDQDWDRWGAEFDYAPPSGPAKGLMVRGEYLTQRKFLAISGKDRESHSKGWYLEGAYRLNPLPGILSNFEPAFRYEQFRQDMNTPHSDITRTTVGLNYWFNKYCRLLTNYEWYDAEEGVNPTLNSRSLSNVNHEVLTTNVQVWF